MKFINECTTDLQVGQLAQFNDAGLIDTLSTGRRIGICTNIKTITVSDDVVTSEILVAEIATSGPALIPLSVSASWQGCDLYSNGNTLSTVINGDALAYLIPKGLGAEKLDFQAGDLATVVLL